MSEAHLRKPASMWLAVTTLFGLAGTVAGLLPVVLVWSGVREGTVSFGTALLTMVPYCSLMICPIVAWWMLLRQRYKLALIIASPPILIWAVSMLINAIR